MGGQEGADGDVRSLEGLRDELQRAPRACHARVVHQCYCRLLRIIAAFLLGLSCCQYGGRALLQHHRRMSVSQSVSDYTNFSRIGPVKCRTLMALST